MIMVATISFILYNLLFLSILHFFLQTQHMTTFMNIYSIFIYTGFTSFNSTKWEFTPWSHIPDITGKPACDVHHSTSACDFDAYLLYHFILDNSIICHMFYYYRHLANLNVNVKPV